MIIPSTGEKMNFQKQLRFIRWVIVVLVVVMLAVIAAAFIFSMNDECIGRGTFEGWRTYDMKSSVKSRIVKIHFHDGETVKAGEVMLELDSSELQNAIAAVESNIAELEAELKVKTAAMELDISELERAIAGVEANILELESELEIKRSTLKMETGALQDAVRDAQSNIQELEAELTVKRTALALLRHDPLPEEYRHTAIALEERKILLDASVKKVEAYKKLQESGAMAELKYLDHQIEVERNQKELEKLEKDFATVNGLAGKIISQAEAEVKLQEVRIANRRQELTALQRKLEEYSSARAKAEIDMQQVRIANQRKELESLKSKMSSTRIARAQAEIAMLETRIANRNKELAALRKKMKEYQFVAPEDGVIASIPTKPGTYVEPGMSVIQFAAGQERKFIAYVDEVEIFKIEEKQSVRIASSQYSTYEYGYFQGEVMYIGELPVERAGKVYYPVFIRVTYEPQPLRLGSSGEARISTGRDRIIRTIMGTNHKRKSGAK